MQRFVHYFLFFILSCSLFWQPIALAGDIDIAYARVQQDDNGYRLAAHFKFELSQELENLITSGIPLYFDAEAQITRPRWYWFDEKTLASTQTVRISYNVITRQYRASVNGGVAQNYAALNDALSLVRNPSRWLIADTFSLKYGVTYTVAVRSRLDTTKLPKPLQFNALNNSDWRLSSDWKYITFKADEK